RGTPPPSENSSDQMARADLTSFSVRDAVPDACGKALAHRPGDRAAGRSRPPRMDRRRARIAILPWLLPTGDPSRLARPLRCGADASEERAARLPGERSVLGSAGPP